MTELTLEKLNEILGEKYPLTESQFKFVKSFCTHHKGMRAIREAGYNHSTPGSQSSAAYRLLKQSRIQKAILHMRRSVES